MDSSTITNEFGKRLNLLRTEKGLSQEALAEAVGYSKGAISFYELGKRTPDIVFLSVISDYFRVSPDYLLGRSDVRTTDPDLKAIYDDIGLSDITIENIKQIPNETVLKLLNILFETGEMTNTIEIIAQYALYNCMMLSAARLYKKLQQLNSDTSECECNIKEYRQNAGYFETSASMQIKTMLDVSRRYLAKTFLELNDDECNELLDITNSFYKGKELNIDFRQLFDGIFDEKGADEDG